MTQASIWQNFDVPACERAKKIVTIPASIPFGSSAMLEPALRRKVAAYARVSTKTDEQDTSYKTQIKYYSDYIRSHDSWEFVAVYTDKESGTSTKRREGFNAMMNDALSGKIDLILTKSVSRFGRNTVDTLLAIRKLKEKGVEVFFEEQNMYTLDSKGEVMLTIMSSLAQDESRNISENVTWGQRKRFADGKVAMPYGHFLGYRKGANGEPEIDELEAAIVRRIYRDFLTGCSPWQIAKSLTEEGIPTPSKKGKKWLVSVILSILRNEKYKGDALLQKTFTVDFLTKEKKKNEGEVPQYYVENSHPAIIPKDVFDHVQAELDRMDGTRRTSKHTIFSGKIFCGECGSIYGSKVWHSTDKYRRVIWQCNAKYNNEKKCCTPHITEEQLKSAFLAAFNETLEERDELLKLYRTVLQEAYDPAEYQAQAEAAEQEYAEVRLLMEKSIEKNATIALNQTEYNRYYDSLLNRSEAAKAKLTKAKEVIRAQEVKRRKLLAFMAELAKRPALVTEFDGELWIAVVEKVTVYEDRVIFEFKNGEEHECMF